MPKFRVCVREVWIQMVDIEASDKDDAIKKVSDGQGVHLETDGGFEYSHTLDPDTWTADKDEPESQKATRRFPPPT